MARIFRRQRNLHPVAELNVTNMVDLGFTLLIIFMITTPLIQSEQTIPVNLPVESKKAQDVLPETEFQVVSMRSRPSPSSPLFASALISVCNGSRSCGSWM